MNAGESLRFVPEEFPFICPASEILQRLQRYDVRYKSVGLELIVDMHVVVFAIVDDESEVDFGKTLLKNFVQVFLLGRGVTTVVQDELTTFGDSLSVRGRR